MNPLILKSLAFVLLGISVLLICGCQKNDVSEDDFLLSVDFDNYIESGKDATFHCELTVPTKMKINHSSQLISYEVDGNRETITDQGIVEYFSKGQVIERDITLTFDKKGNYTIIFFSEFKIADEEFPGYRIQKEVKITVH